MKRPSRGSSRALPAGRLDGVFSAGPGKQVESGLQRLDSIIGAGRRGLADSRGPAAQIAYERGALPSTYRYLSGPCIGPLSQPIVSR